MAIEGIDSVTGGGRRRRFLRAGKAGKQNAHGARDKAEDFPLFYRTRESMVIDEAICASLRRLDDGGRGGDDRAGKQEESVPTSPCIAKGEELSNNEVETIRKVVRDVDDMVQTLMGERFNESIFTCGVLNCFLIAFVFFVCPENFWVLYLIEMMFLVPLNQYHRCKAKPLNKSLYYLDFCWVANLIAIASLLTIVVHSIIANAVGENFEVLPDSARKQLFMAVLGTSCGPLLAATGVLPYIALLFHDIDCMTGLFIHIFPPMEAYTLRWHAPAIKSAWPNYFHLNYLDSVHFLPLNDGVVAKIRHLPSTVAGNALILYLVWSLLYTSWMLYCGLDLPRNDRKVGTVPKYDTCFHSFMRGGACIAIGQTLWARPRRVSLKQIDSNHFEKRDVIVHMIYHAFTTLASIFILGYACYSSQIVHGAALIIMTAIAVKRGAHRYSYYSTSLYSTTLQKHFNILLSPASSHLIEKKDEVDVGPDEELDCLEYLLRNQVRSLRTRVGLVPNYFITRGESVPTKDKRSAEGIFRRLFAWFLKLFQPSDFRDTDSHAAFVDTIGKLRQFGDGKNASIAKRAKAIFNKSLDRYGNTALHLLIKKRQIKFTKQMLLICGNNSFIDVNKPNAAGQTPLDFALDRLEVETVYLLHLFGATKSSSSWPASNSLGYIEWIIVDLIANLDTGRTLNRASIVAIMNQIFDSKLATTELLSWAYGQSDGKLTDEMVRALGSLPQLYGLVLADGCDAITSHESFATLIRFLFSLHLDSHTYSDSNNLVEDEAGALPGLEDLPTPKVCNDLYAFLKDHGIDLTSRRVAGRTLFFNCYGNDTKYALKLAKSFEEDKQPHPLAKEAAMDSSMANLKHRLDLVSEYPSRSELITIKELPTEFREAVEGQRSKGFHRFEVSNRSEGITALLYCPPEGYERYANDPTLSLEECQSGIFKAAFDYSRLAASGLMHGTLTDIQHDAREGRPHLWSFESFLTRFRGGAGRIARGFAGLAAPNVRVSGLADLKHTLTKAQVIARYDPSHIHAQHNLLYDPRERFQVSLIEQLGAGLFATSLLIASSWEGRHRQGIKPNLDLANALEEGFVQFLRGYLQVPSDRARQLLNLMGTNFNLTANQIKLFATGEYVEIAELAPARPYFGIIAKILGKLTHPTAFVHFMQRGERDLTKPGCSLEEIRSVYQFLPRDDGLRVIPEGYPRVDTSMMRCSPTWIKGHGWMDQKGQPHFGSYEGVLPFQQLIRDIYAVVHLASLILLSNIAAVGPDDNDGDNDDVSADTSLHKEGEDRAQ